MYQKDKDLIYRNLASFYDEDYLDDLVYLVQDNYKYLPLKEIIHQRLIHSVYHSVKELPSATDLLLLLLFHRDFITVDQMERIGLFGNRKSGLNTVNRLSRPSAGKKGKGAQLQVLTTQSKTPVYALSKSERERFLLNDATPDPEKAHVFPNEYVADNGIRRTSDYPSEVRDHEIELLYLFYDLLCNENLLDFQWLPKSVLRPDNSYNALRNQFRNFSHALSRSEYPEDAVVPDAVIVPWEDSVRQIYFVEQDMMTEHAEKLSKKFNKYNRLLDTLPLSDLPCESILFPTYVKRGSSDDKKADQRRSSNQAKHLLPEIKSAMEVLKVNTLRDLERKLNDEIKKRKGIEDAQDTVCDRVSESVELLQLSILKFLSRVTEFDRTINSMDDLKRYINACEEKEALREQSKAEEGAIVAMQRRTEHYRNAIEACGGLKDKCLNGLSIFAYDNRSDAVPYVFLPNSGLCRDLAELCRMSLYELGTSKTVTMEPYGTIIHKGETYLLRNLLRFKDNPVPTAVEVVAYDIGARYRVERILNTMDISFPCNLCLVVSSELQATAINRDFMVRDVFFREDEARKQKGVITIAYCLAEPSLSGKRLFFFDSEGRVRYR